MSILHKYILKELFYYFFVFGLVFVSILTAKETFDTRDEILEDNPAPMLVVRYIAHSLPTQIVEAIPLITLLGVLFAIGMMARERELIAMVASGVSFNYLAIPVLIFGITISISAFFFAEYVAPNSQRKAGILYKVDIKHESVSAILNDDRIFTKGEGRRFYVLDSFDSTRNEMTRPLIIDTKQDGSSLGMEIMASRAVLDPGTRTWVFTDFSRTTFPEEGEPIYEKYDEEYRMELETGLEKLLSKEKKDSEQTLTDLAERREVLRRQRSNPIQLAKVETLLFAKYAYPFSCLIMAFIGFCLAADIQNRRMVLAFTFGLVTGATYYLVRQSLINFGTQDWIPPIMAAWAPVMIFSLIIAIMYRRLNTVH